MRLAGIVRFLIAALLSWALTVSAQDEPAATAHPVLVISSGTGGAYDDAISSFKQELGKLRPHTGVQVLTVESASRISPGNTQIILTLGLRAAELTHAASEHHKIINALIPSYGFHHLQESRDPSEQLRTTALFIDQPVKRQIGLIRVALPNWKEVAIIDTTASSPLADSLENEAQRHGLIVRRTRLDHSDGLYDAMRQTLTNRAALIALPDRHLYNPDTIQNILLTSFRMRSPVIGFSTAYVRAGSLLGVYTRPDQVGTEAARMVDSLLHGLDLPPPSYPSLFEIGVNMTVSRSLGIPLEPAAMLEARLRQAEGTQP